MNATKPKFTCDECRPPFGDGWHYSETADGEIVAAPCPNKAITEQHQHAQELAKLANENAWEAARQIMRDVAQTLPLFNANLIRDRFDQSGVPTSLRGSAFRWAADQQLIRKAGSVMSDQDTTRHEVGEWISLVHRRASA